MLLRSMLSIGNLSLRKKLIVLASLGVFLPLVVLTYLQYRSLAELQSKTKSTFRENIRQGITLLQHQMKERLKNVAAQTLNPIDNIHLSSPAAAEELEKHFADVKRSHPEIEEIFAFRYRGDKQATD